MFFSSKEKPSNEEGFSYEDKFYSLISCILKNIGFIFVITKQEQMKNLMPAMNMMMWRKLTACSIA